MLAPKKLPAVFLAIMVPVNLLSAQTVIKSVQLPAGKAAESSSGIRSVPSSPSSRPTGKTPGKPEKSAKPGEKSAKPGGKSGDKAKSETTPKTVRRPTTPAVAADSAELKVRPDKDGKLQFNFKGQPWPDVLEWLADVSGMSLDWQEAPDGYLDLTTRRSYTVAETRDTINRLLLARGFTLLHKDDVLSVVNITKLNPGMVPRVKPEELAQRDPHEFVKVSFSLDSLLAETAVEELKPMLSPNGKLTQLKTTNRLEAIDAVVNLQEIYALLTEEQSTSGQEGLVASFQLKHTRAADVKVQLQELLGIDTKKKSAAAMTPQQKMQQAQQMAAMRAQQKKKGAAPPKPKVEIHIVANERDNTILVNAPPDKIAIIEQAINIIDQPTQREPLLRNLEGIKVYRLAGIDPETLVKTLEQRGDLDPTTRLEVDKKNKAIIAFANPVDHATIGLLVEKLDGSGRRFDVIQLRRLEAEYVAGTVEFMMGGGEKESQSSRSRYYYDYYYSSRRRGSESEPSDKFRVDADIENNKLLLYANDVELQQVENLLVKLGEIPPKGGNSSTIRVIDAAPGEDTEELLQRLRRAWPSFGRNPLLVAPPKKSPEQPPEEKSRQPLSPTKGTTTQRPADNTPDNTLKSSPTASGKGRVAGNSRVAVTLAARPFLRFAQLSQEKSADKVSPDGGQKDVESNGSNNDSGNLGSATDGRSSQGQPAKTTDELPPPISITRGPNGGLIIRSDDTRALDVLEDLMAELAPPRKDYHVFTLKYADAFWVASNLEEFFKEEEDGDSNRDNYYRYYWGYPPSSKKKGSRRLSRRRPLKFISDTDTNTILVQGADATQLKTIEDLIKLYDQQMPTDSHSARKTQIFQIRYSRARVIAEAVKDVYRDLLSSNDKALQDNKKQNQKPRVERIYTYIEGGDANKRTPVRFKGLLSIGVDELSNTLVVSAPESLLENISQMIEALDEAAKPASTVQVLQVDRRVNSVLLQQKLAEIFGSRTPGRQPQGKKPSPSPQKTGPGQSNKSPAVSIQSK